MILVLPVNKGVHKSSHVSGLISGTGILRGVWQLHIHLYAYVSPTYRQGPHRHRL